MKNYAAIIFFVMVILALTCVGCDKLKEMDSDYANRLEGQAS